MSDIKFHQPYATDDDFKGFAQSPSVASRGAATSQCELRLQQIFAGSKALLTPSCTAALELIFLAQNFEPGDEVIVPSYTFVTSASAFALRGLKPVFVDVNTSDLCLDVNKIEAAISSRTRAVLTVHYGGWSCDMAALEKICLANKLSLFEDAAQAIGSTFSGRSLGTWGAMGAVSFHHTKNIHCGEGGALLANASDEDLLRKIERIYEKGTNRAGFLRGDDAFYTWTDLGSSFIMSELSAHLLNSQLQHLNENLNARKRLWQNYHSELSVICKEKSVSTPSPSRENNHSAHLFYLIFSDRGTREKFQQHMAQKKIEVIPHYVPLHQSPMGKKLGRVAGDMTVTDWVGQGLVRLPIYPQMSLRQSEIIEHTLNFVRRM